MVSTSGTTVSLNRLVISLTRSVVSRALSMMRRSASACSSPKPVEDRMPGGAMRPSMRSSSSSGAPSPSWEKLIDAVPPRMGNCRYATVPSRSGMALSTAMVTLMPSMFSPFMAKRRPLTVPALTPPTVTREPTSTPSAPVSMGKRTV